MLRRLAVATVVLGMLALLGAGGAFWAATRLYRAPGPLPEAADIVVPRGTIARVGASLRASGVVSDPLALRIAALVTRGDGPIHAAEFAFPARASLATVLRILRTSHPVEHDITIPEGLTAAEIAGIVARDDLLAGPLVLPREGGVLPQTYAFERGTTRGALLRRMEAAERTALDRVWRGRDPDTGLRSPAELVILASIVERETARPSERPMVARVFLNRLRAGMKLQSDPTTAYAATGGLGALRRPLTRADLALANPYNTYAVAGLPPGPIAAPGLASLEAVAHPAPGDALYFVADGTGGHAFAATLADHVRNVERYRAMTAQPVAVPGVAAAHPSP